MTSAPVVLAAIRALIVAACPGAIIKGFTEDASKPERIPAAGVVIGDPGDPGDADIDLSPLTYNFAHHIPVEVCLPVTREGDTPLRALLAPIGAAIASDRTLGGQCDFLDITGVTFETDDVTGAIPTRSARFEIIAFYASSNPLAA